jgi:hypothetical protein
MFRSDSLCAVDLPACESAWAWFKEQAMSDTDEATDLEAARNAMFNERFYTLGWRSYLSGMKEPVSWNAHCVRGWRDAKHAREACGRNLMWSMDCTFPAMNSL